MGGLARTSRGDDLQPIGEQAVAAVNQASQSLLSHMRARDLQTVGIFPAILLLVLASFQIAIFHH